jgi:ketosteroid isomerase-like protein
MRSRSLAFMAVVLALGVASCSAPQVKEFGREDADQIRKFVQDFCVAYNAKDAAKMMTFYSGAAILMPPNASTVRGQESIQGYYLNRFNVDGATDLAIEPRDISGQGPLAYMSGAFSLKLRPEGKPEGHDRGKILFILRNLAKTWKIEISMWSSDLPPAVPAPAKPAEAPAKK